VYDITRACTYPYSQQYPSDLEWFRLLESALPTQGRISERDLMTHSRKLAINNAIIPQSKEICTKGQQYIHTDVSGLQLTVVQL